MVEVRTGVVFAKQAVTDGGNRRMITIIFFFGRSEVGEEFFVVVDVETAVTGVAGRQDTVEDMPALFD